MPELANESNSYPDVSPEWVVQIDPDIILQSEPSTKNYTEDELSQLRDEIMSRPELQSVKAVEDGRVFVMSGKITSGIRAIVVSFIYLNGFIPNGSKMWTMMLCTWSS